jgi:hypothetical protein
MERTGEFRRHSEQFIKERGKRVIESAAKLKRFARKKHLIAYIH